MSVLPQAKNGLEREGEIWGKALEFGKNITISTRDEDTEAQETFLSCCAVIT